MSELTTRLQCVAEDDSSRYPADVKRLCAEAASVLAEAEKVIQPLAAKKVPYRPQGNAGAYSLLFDEIRAAHEWQRRFGGSTAPWTWAVRQQGIGQRA